MAATTLRLTRTRWGRANGGKAWTREALVAKVWNIKKDVQTRTVDVHVKRLRGKLGESGRYIETVRGVGYRLCRPVDLQESVARESEYGQSYAGETSTSVIG